MDISGLFAGSLQALRSRLGLFVLLVIFPSLLAIVTFLLTAAIIGGAVAASNRNPNGGLVILGVIVFIAGLVLTWLAALKVYGMISLAAYEIAQGQRPDFKGVFARSKGYLPRFVALILLALVAFIVVQVVLVVIFGGLFTAASANDNRGLAGAAVASMLLLFLLGIPLSIFLSVKLLYIVPAIAIEQYSGFDALKRSWNLTKGSFWRTFGYAIVPALAVAAISYVISLLTGLIVSPMGRGPVGTNPGDVTPFLLAMVPVLTISLILQLAVSLFTLPFLQSYNTYMYIDQIRRKELVGQQGGYPEQSLYPPQGQQYPPQGQQYPPQGQQYPPQGQQYPPQGQQYPPQGQQYPPQGQQYPPQGQQYPPQGQQYPPQGQQYPPQGYPAQGQQPPQAGQPQHYPAQDPSAPPQNPNQWGQNPGQSQPPTPSN